MSSDFQNSVLLNFNSRGQISLQLPQGSQSDFYKLYIYVSIIDDSNGKTVYTFSNPVYVYPNKNQTSFLAEVYQSLFNNDPTNQLIVDLNSQSLNPVCNSVVLLASNMNSQSVLAEPKLINEMSKLRESLLNRVLELSLSNTSSFKMISSAVGQLTSVPEQISSSIGV